MSIKQITCALALAAMSLPVVAGNAGLFYFDGALGRGQVNESVTGLQDNNTGLAWNLNVGYNYTDTWAVELGYVSYPNEDFSSTVKGSNNNSLHVAAKGSMVVTDEIRLWSKLGLANVSHKIVGVARPIDESKVTGMIGLGGSYLIQEDFEVGIGLHTTTKSGDVPAMHSGLVSFTWTMSGL